MADKTITFSSSIVAQKDLSEGSDIAYITQLSKPIILKGVSTKTCQNVLYSIDGINFTEETNIGDEHVLSMAIVPFQLGGAEIGSSYTKSKDILLKAFSYILGERNIREDINIDAPISNVSTSSYAHANGAYRYLLQYLEKNQDKIEWDTGDLFSALDADKQDSFGGSDFITDKISLKTPAHANAPYELSIDKQTDANGSILKPAIRWGDPVQNNTIIIKQSPYFFLYPEGCPAPDGNPDKLIIDNFWRGGGLLESYTDNYDKSMFILYIFAVS